MENVGAEVGQKMRVSIIWNNARCEVMFWLHVYFQSAIKAKLMELGCYVGKFLLPLPVQYKLQTLFVDDELPDYIMVMVANKRTKSQMNEDLQLFLNTKTKTFVEWLQIVLKKLKQVTVTNPGIYVLAFYVLSTL